VSLGYFEGGNKFDKKRKTVMQSLKFAPFAKQRLGQACTKVLCVANFLGGGEMAQ
jgi:hypothetical protein